MRPWSTVCPIALLLVASLVLLPTSPVFATTITVTTTADEFNSDGDCSLREAVLAANLDTAVDQCAPGSGNDTIKLLASVYYLTMDGGGEDAGVSGDLDLTSTVSIDGAGISATIIDGNAIDRVVHVLGGATVSLSNMTIRNGWVAGGADGITGGGIYNAGSLHLTGTVISGSRAANGEDVIATGGGGGGGIYNTGNLTITRSTIQSNASLGLYVDETNTVYPGMGGGIANMGALTISESDVASNASNIGGGLYNGGGTLTLLRSRVVDNTIGPYYRGEDGFGGGVVVAGGSATIDETTINNNQAGASCYGAGYGGGIVNQATLTVTKSTINNNTASSGCWGSGAGGGIGNSGTLTLLNSTVSSNTAESGGEVGATGAGITNGGTLRVRSSTISANDAEPGPDASYGRGPGLENVGDSSVYVHNSIIAGNVSGDSRRPECSGTVISEGYNLIRNTLDCTITGNTVGNIVNTSSGLASLGDNGGPTRTHMLQAGSRAIDGGDTAICPATDQRGVARPQGTRCDIGAVELRVNSSPSPSPSTAPSPSPSPSAPGSTRRTTYLPLILLPHIALPSPNPSPGPSSAPAPSPSSSPTPSPSASPAPSPSASPAPLPPSYNNCQADPYAGQAPNTPVRIVAIDKSAESVTLRNVTGFGVDISGWRICSITGNQLHATLSGTLAPNETRIIQSQAGSSIWNNTSEDDGALYNASGSLISYRDDQ